MRRIPERLTANARALRNEATPAERLLWCRLSIYRPRFTRQLVVIPFIIDIAHRTARLAIELDGGQHDDAREADARRTAYLVGQGWIVLRFWNREVIGETDGVVEAILLAACERLGSQLQPVSPRIRLRPPEGLPSLQGRG